MKIGVIGAGAMGGALANGILNGNVIPADELYVSNRSKGKLESFAQRGAHVSTSNREVAEAADWLCIAVKPWLVEGVLAEFADLLTEKKTLLCLAAGIKGTELTQWAGKACNILTVIPNIAIAQGESMTFVLPVKATDELTTQVSELFEKMGKVHVCDDKLLQAGLALASCGIAYAFRYIRAACEGGIELGFDARQSRDIVMQTFLGAVTLLQRESLHPEVAVDRVTTPGGITIRGLNAMEEAGFTNAVIQGLKACLK